MCVCVCVCMKRRARGWLRPRRPAQRRGTFIIIYMYIYMYIFIYMYIYIYIYIYINRYIWLRVAHAAEHCKARLRRSVQVGLCTLHVVQRSGYGHNQPNLGIDYRSEPTRLFVVTEAGLSILRRVFTDRYTQGTTSPLPLFLSRSSLSRLSLSLSLSLSVCYSRPERTTTGLITSGGWCKSTSACGQWLQCQANGTNVCRVLRPRPPGAGRPVRAAGGGVHPPRALHLSHRKHPPKRRRHCELPHSNQ